MSSLSKNTCREILRSPGRFLAILAIIVLGSGFFVGLRVSQKAMKATADTYLQKTGFYDFSAATTLGLTGEDVEALLADPDIQDAEGSFETDALVNLGGKADQVFAFHSLPERINTPDLLEGRLPVSPGECLADSWTNLSVGDRVIVSGDNDPETLELFTVRELTVTGIATSPLYLNFERGSTSLGTGSVTAFCYVPVGTFDVDYFTTVYLRCPHMPAAYSEEYDRRAEALEERLTGLVEERAEARYASVIAEAEAQLADGQAEYDDARREYLDRRADGERDLADAEEKLADALRELEDGEAEYSDSLVLYEDGKRELADGETRLADARAVLEDGERSYEDGQAEYSSSLDRYNAGAAELAERQAELEAGRAAFDAQAPAALAAVNGALAGLGLPYRYDTVQTLAAAAEADPVLASLPGVGTLLETYQVLESGSRELEDAALRLGSAKASLDSAAQVLSDTRRELDDGWREYRDGMAELEDARAELEDAARELEDGRRELDEGWQEYRDGLDELEDARAEFEASVSDTEAELADAQAELEDARREIGEIEYPDAYLLGRWSNLGYVCFENDTSIVRSISAVFPVFFFLVAALICITTVSRMVEEQRSQLGVLMALGYSRLKVMGKFLIYSGTATVVGGVTGILLGSKLIPLVIWQAYKIMYSFSDRIEFTVDLPLFGITFALYLVAMMSVTWLSCRREVSDVPANVIRPRPPKAGKRVILERVPVIWNRLSFLWKVTVRNIFRYKLRVLMMILGVAGCTALMLTGMGINDSVRNVVDYQFTEISLYDYSVTFADPLTDETKADFLTQTSGLTESVLFLHQASVTASAGHSEKEVQLSAVDPRDVPGISEFMDFHRGSKKLPFPGAGQALINRGLADALDVGPGDVIELRPDGSPAVSLTVSGVFDNYIYNTVYISSGTIPGDTEQNYALVLKNASADAGEALAGLLGADNVLTATSSLDLRARIGNMMASLIYIVLLTVICAAALAFVVIYNLTNINIQERLREIATVKVLGFYNFESALYVLRENLLLTLLGAAAGIPMGIALNAFVVGKVELDMIHFVPRIAPVSYLCSVALTILFSLLVDLFMLRRLNSIDTAAALKAAE